MKPINQKIFRLKEQSEYLSIPTLEGFEMIDLKDVLYLQANNSYTIFHMDDNSKVIATKNLGYYEDELYNDPFLRIHQSFIININKVKRYVRADNGYIILVNKVVIGVSKSRKDALLVFFKMRRISNTVSTQPIIQNL